MFNITHLRSVEIKVPRHLRPTSSSSHAHTTTLVSPAPNDTTNPWLLDSGASHHVTSDFSNLSLHYPYDGTNEIVIADGLGLSITHFGSTTLSTSTISLCLKNVLFVSSMKKNIISISKLCSDNNISIVFSPSSFSLNDSHTGSTILTGPARNGVYYWPSQSSPQSLAAQLTTEDLHYRLNHPASPILKQLTSFFNSSIFNNSPCNSCFIYKSRKLPFTSSSLVTTSPLQAIFSNLWSSPVPSFNAFKYYVIFVDHFTKYVWLYPLKKKSDTYQTFVYFQALVEKKFSTSIIILYSDNGREYQKLASSLASYGISHLTSPPHTP